MCLISHEYGICSKFMEINGYKLDTALLNLVSTLCMKVYQSPIVGGIPHKMFNLVLHLFRLHIKSGAASIDKVVMKLHAKLIVFYLI